MFYKGVELAGQAAKTFGPALTKGAPAVDGLAPTGDDVSPEGLSLVQQAYARSQANLGQDVQTGPLATIDYSPTKVELSPGQTTGIRAAFARIFGG